MIVTHSLFRRYQEVFYQKLLRTPFTIQLEFITVRKETSSTEFSIKSFVGDSPRDPSKFHTFNALYEREIPLRMREKYGLSKEVNGIVYLSPLQLIPVIGTYKLNWNTTKVHFAERVQVIQKIELLEPLYNSCIGLQLFLKDDLKGG